MGTYSSEAYRSFKTFIGELTAVAAGVYVGIQEVVPLVEKVEGADPWKAVAEKHGVIVDALKSDQVVLSSVRLNLVSLYSGFDLFIADVRSEFNHLQGRVWNQLDGDGPFEALARNTPSTPGAHVRRLGAHRIAAMNHYRLVRNAIAHPRPSALAASEKFFMSNSELLGQVRSEYGMQSAPNKLDGVTYHDIKLLARIALDLTKAIDADLDPGDDRFRELLKARPVDKTKSSERNHHALMGWLRTAHGLSAERADRILKAHMTHQLDG